MANREETVTEVAAGNSADQSVREFHISEADLTRYGGRVRLDRFLADQFSEIGRSRIQEAIDAGHCTVAGKVAKSSHILVPGASVVLAVGKVAIQRALTVEPKPLAQPLEILYEDQHLIVVNKPAGVTVHPGAGTQDEVTLVHALLAHCGSLPELVREDVVSEDAGDGWEAADHSVHDSSYDSSEAGMEHLASLRPGIVHRLDRDTTGAMVVAKTLEAHRHLAAQFHDKSNFRQYLVLCTGHMPVEVLARESWLGRDPGHRTRFRSYVEDGAGRKYAKTLFRREATFSQGCSLISARLYTGRTHQIRVHARDVGLPVMGDASYGDDSRLSRELKAAATRQMLHAWKLGFVHPSTGQRLDFEAPLPQDFSAVLEILLA